MKRLHLPFALTGALTRQFLILVAVAILSTQMIDLVVTLTLPPAVSGVTMGLALSRLQQAAAAVEAGPASQAQHALKALGDRRVKFYLLPEAPPPVPAGESAALSALAVRALGLPPSEIRIGAVGPRHELHLPPPRNSRPAGRGVRPRTPPGVTIDQAAFDISPLPRRPFVLAVRSARGWIAIQDAEFGERIWLRRAIPDLAIAFLLILPIALWVGSRIGAQLRNFTGVIERSGSIAAMPHVEEEGPKDVRLMIRAFNLMQARIRTLLADQAMMMAAISHDVRTPLARIRFRTNDLPEDVRRAIAVDIEEIDELVDALLGLTRTDQAPMRTTRFDLSALAQSITDELADAGAQVQFDGPDRAPMLGDPASVKRIISNLTQNALKYAGSAVVRLKCAGERAEVAVEDNGPGVPVAMAEAIFEPFRRLEASRNRSNGGSGMGLAIARHLARKAGGDLTLDTSFTSGARFVLTLPRGLADAA